MALMPMTGPEITAWLSALATTRRGRIKSMQNLLHHQEGDRMSLDDRAIIRRELSRLQYEEGQEAA